MEFGWSVGDRFENDVLRAESLFSAERCVEDDLLTESWVFRRLVKLYVNEKEYQGIHRHS